MTTFADLQDRYDSMEPPEFYEHDFEEPEEEYDMKMMRKEYDVEMMREALDAHTPTAANAGDQEPERLTIAQSREYLVKFMEKHFTDKTFHRYIRAERDGVNLATDFAWQMVRALRMIERTPTATNADGLDVTDAALEDAVQAVAARAGDSETILVINAFDAIRALKKNRFALPSAVMNRPAAKGVGGPCFHSNAVIQHTGCGTPVEFCPDCGTNRLAAKAAGDLKGGAA